MHEAILYPQEFARRANFIIAANGASVHLEIRVLILRGRERVSRKALSGGTVRWIAKPSGRVILTSPEP